MRFLLQAAFASSRFEIVAMAQDGEEALTMWEHHHDVVEAVALDHRMPGLDGLDVARRILEAAPEMPIVLFSAELGADLEAEARGLGVAVLHKDDILTLPDHPKFA